MPSPPLISPRRFPTPPRLRRSSCTSETLNYSAEGLEPGSTAEQLAQLRRMVAEQTEQMGHLRTELAQIAGFLHAYPPSPSWAKDGPTSMTGTAPDSLQAPRLQAGGGGPPRRSCQRLDA